MVTKRFTLVSGFVAGLAALAGAGWFYFAAEAGPALEIDTGDLSLPECAAGEKREVVFKLHNRSGRPIDVLGLSGSCGLNSCLSPRRDNTRYQLPPGENEFVCLLEIGRAGEFRSQVFLFVDDQGAREIMLSVHGTARGPSQDKKAEEP